MNEATLAILLQLRGQETVAAGLRTAGTEMGSMTQNIIAQRTVFRELAMGVSHLGMTFLSLGVAMQSTNNELMKSVGQTFAMLGGFLSSVAAAFQFVRAIAMMVDALKKLQQAQIISLALSGPRGWAILAGAGIAVAGATAYFATREKTTATANINTTVNLDGKKVGELVQRNLALKADQNYGTDRTKLFGR